MTGCGDLGWAYFQGAGVAKDEAKGFAFSERACRAGNSGGCLNTAVQYRLGLGVERNVARALAIAQHACDAGRARGCSELGLFYEFGDGVPRDLTIAEQLYERGCEGSYPHACTSLARLLFARRAVGHDNRWLQLFEWSCQAYDGFACGKLGAIYQNGDGVPKDAELGALFVQRACQLGETALCSTTSAQSPPVAPRAESK
jgi:TPR repeat protein